MSVEVARRLIEHLDSRIREEELGNPFFKDARALSFVTSQYLDLIQGKVPKEFIKDTKKAVRLSLGEMCAR